MPAGWSQRASRLQQVDSLRQAARVLAGRTRRPYSNRMEVHVPPATAGRRNDLAGGCAQRATFGHAEFTMESAASSIVEAFRATLDLFHTGLDLMRQNLRRRHPDAADEDIERRLHEWLLERPGAESGDCSGRSVDVRTRLA
jgi:hypothetical protein